MYNRCFYLFLLARLFFFLLLPDTTVYCATAALSCHPLPLGTTLIKVDLDVHVSQPADTTDSPSIHPLLATCNATSIPVAPFTGHRQQPTPISRPSTSNCSKVLFEEDRERAYLD